MNQSIPNFFNVESSAFPNSVYVTVEHLPTKTKKVTVGGDEYVFGVDYLGKTVDEAVASLVAAINGDAGVAAMNPKNTNPLKPYFARFYKQNIFYRYTAMDGDIPVGSTVAAFSAEQARDIVEGSYTDVSIFPWRSRYVVRIMSRCLTDVTVASDDSNVVVGT